MTLWIFVNLCESLYTLNVCVCAVTLSECPCIVPCSTHWCACIHNPSVVTRFIDLPLYYHTWWCSCQCFFICVFSGNWLKRSSLSGLTDGVEDLLDISSVDRLSFIRQSSKVSSPPLKATIVCRSFSNQPSFWANRGLIWSMLPADMHGCVYVCLGEVH